MRRMLIAALAPAALLALVGGWAVMPPTDRTGFDLTPGPATRELAVGGAGSTTTAGQAPGDLATTFPETATAIASNSTTTLGVPQQLRPEVTAADPNAQDAVAHVRDARDKAVSARERALAARKAALAAQRQAIAYGKPTENGYGLLRWRNGDRYEGEVYDNKENGYGVYIWANGKRWEGEMHNDMGHGYGVFVWPNGGRYEGAFHGGKSGYGILTWADGKRYEGEFRDDERNGWGYMSADGGEIRTGYWENDQLVRPGETVIIAGAQESTALPPAAIMPPQPVPVPPAATVAASGPSVPVPTPPKTSAEGQQAHERRAAADLDAPIERKMTLKSEILRGFSAAQDCETIGAYWFKNATCIDNTISIETKNNTITDTFKYGIYHKTYFIFNILRKSIFSLYKKDLRDDELFRSEYRFYYYQAEKLQKSLGLSDDDVCRIELDEHAFENCGSFVRNQLGTPEAPP